MEGPGVAVYNLGLPNLKAYVKQELVLSVDHLIMRNFVVSLSVLWVGLHFFDFEY